MTQQISLKIRDHVQNKSSKLFEEYVLNVNKEKLLTTLKNEFSSRDFVDIWGFILKSLKNTDVAREIRFEIVSAILNEIEEKQLETPQTNKVLKQLVIDRHLFKPYYLVKFCENFKKLVQTGKFSGTAYTKLLPNVIENIMSVNCIEYNCEEVSGVEYKKQFINSLIVLEWSPNSVIALTSTFNEMLLSKDEHLQIVSKLGQCMKKLTHQEIPVFTYQLINFCSTEHGHLVFFRLQHYFNSLYTHIEMDSETNSESVLDVIESSSNIDLFEAENVILYHINQAASSSHASINDYLACLKHLLKSPEYIIHPFHLTILLSLYNINHLEDKISEILKGTISRVLNEQNRKKQSLWLKCTVPDQDKLESVFTQIIEKSVKCRPVVIEGIINLAFTLLNVGSFLGLRDPLTERQWQLGIFILLKVVKQKSSVASFVIKTLSNYIQTMNQVTQLIDCAYFLAQRLTLYVLENQSCVDELMENLLQIPGTLANQLLEAFIPIVKISPTARDRLILLLRKALFSGSTETRQMAVLGFLKLLKNLKVSDLAVLSQSSSYSGSFSSGHSILTQISVNSTSLSSKSVFKNEELCFQVLQILKSCFMQQVEVRAQFYEGVYDAVYNNPELGVAIFNTLWSHFSQFYISDETIMPPIQFSKMYTIKDVDVIVQEPIGKLIYTIALTLTKILESQDEETIDMKNYANELESLCNRMINCELIHFELDDGCDLTDIVPESQEKLIVLKEALIIFEALIGYKIISWGPESKNNEQQLNQLFQGYFRLIQFSKTFSKSKKGSGNKRKQDNNSTSTSQSNETLNKDVDRKSKKPIKLPDTILSLPVITKAFTLLYSKIEWVTTLQINVIKSKPEIHRHFVQAAMFLIHHIKNSHTVVTEQSKLYYDFLVEIGGIVYEYCIECFDNIIDFDSSTAILISECFHLILSTVCCQYKHLFIDFLRIVGRKDVKDANVILQDFIKVYQKLFTMNDEDIGDTELKNLPLVTVNTLSIICNHIPNDNNVLASEVIEWLVNFANTKTLSNKQVACAFISLLFNMNIKYKNTITLFENISKKISAVTGTIHEEETCNEEFTLINELTVHSVLSSLCSSIKFLLDDVNWMTSRIKSENFALSLLEDGCLERKREMVKSKERSVCCQLCLLISILSTLSNLIIQQGPILEGILKSLVHLYGTLNLIAKYFVQRSSKINPAFQTARFEQVVKLVGKSLNSNVYKLIIHIDESERQETQSTQQKQTRKRVNSSALKSKVLKGTKLIPKIIYEIEQFSKSILDLSKKTKVDLSKYIGQGTTRDFRFMGINDVLKQDNDDDASVQETSDDSNTNISLDNTNEVEDETSSQTNSSPPLKKRKK